MLYYLYSYINKGARAYLSIFLFANFTCQPGSADLSQEFIKYAKIAIEISTILIGWHIMNFVEMLSCHINNKPKAIFQFTMSFVSLFF